MLRQRATTRAAADDEKERYAHRRDFSAVPPCRQPLPLIYATPPFDADTLYACQSQHYFTLHMMFR